MKATCSGVKSISISGFKKFFDEIKELTDDLKSAGYPVEEEVRESSSKNEYEQEGLIEIRLNEPINRIDTAFITIVRTPEYPDPTVQRLKIKKGTFGLNTLCVMLSISHPNFKFTLRQEIEALVGKLIS